MLCPENLNHVPLYILGIHSLVQLGNIAIVAIASMYKYAGFLSAKCVDCAEAAQMESLYTQYNKNT